MSGIGRGDNRCVTGMNTCTILDPTVTKSNKDGMLSNTEVKNYSVFDPEENRFNLSPEEKNDLVLDIQETRLNRSLCENNDCVVDREETLFNLSPGK